MRKILLLLLVLASPATAQTPTHREDTAHVSGQYGNLCLAVRQDTATALAAASDYIPFIVDSSGRLWTNALVGDGAGALNVIVDSGAIAATQSGAWSVAIDQTGANNAVDVLTMPTTTVTGTVTCNAGSGTLGTDPSDEDARVLGRVKIHDGTDTALVSGAGALLVDGSASTQPISGTVTVTDGAGALNVIVDSGSITANAGTNLNTSALALDATLTGRLPAGGSPADNESNTNTSLSRMGFFDFAFDGTGWDRIRGDSTDGLLVNLGANNDVTVTGTVTANAGSGTFVVGDGAGALNVIVDSGTTAVTQATASSLNAEVQGDAADGAAVSGNPVRIGGKDGAGNTQDVATDTAGELQVDVLTLPSVIIGTFPDNEPVDEARRGGTAIVAGACERETLLYIQIDQTGGEQLITGTASERIYICSIQLMTATAQNIALVDGTGSVCATSATGLLGGATAATGWNFAANGGIVLPPTRDSYTKTSTDADNVCLLQSGAGQVSGSLTYISIPNI